MKKNLIIFSIITVTAVAVFFRLDIHHGQAQVNSGYNNGDVQSQNTISQGGDLCGGTGGIGQIISVGDGTFTIKRNKDGSSLIVTLTNQTTIETSAGPASLSDLKPGDRVTLVGGPNPDDSFTADTVIVCAEAQENIIGPGAQSGENNVIGLNKINRSSLYLNISVIFLLVLIWIGIGAFLRLKKRKDLIFLLFFTIFYLYIVTVLNYTLFQYQSLLLLKYLAPGLMLNGLATGKSLNLIPLIALTREDVRTSFLNVVLMMPFGFGLPFITNLRMKKVVVVGALFSIAIELLQLITGLIAGITFRVADINDLIFNTVGAAIGYMLFLGFVHVYRRISRNWKIGENPILRYVAERPQIDK